MKPLSFATSSAFTAKSIRRLRDAFPARELLLPAVVIAERLRQLRVKHGDNFDPELIDQFLNDSYLALLIAPFKQSVGERFAELAASLGTSWIPVWPEQRRNVAKHPCGERCRWVDHAVTALAKATGAILVTRDTRILDTCRGDPGFYPEARRPEELLSHD